VASEDRSSAGSGSSAGASSCRVSAVPIAPAARGGTGPAVWSANGSPCSAGSGWGLIELGLTGLLGIIVGRIAFVPNLVAAVALATAIGATSSFLGVITISWLQERTEPRLIGRVMSFAMFSAVALDPISFALAGVLAELDLTAMFLAAGALLLLTAALGALSRTMREVN
jgi:hypothetical protein